MPDIVDDTPQPFTPWSALKALTLCGIALAFLRIAPPPEDELRAGGVLAVTIVILIFTSSVFGLLLCLPRTSPLFCGWVATIASGGVLGVICLLWSGLGLEMIPAALFFGGVLALFGSLFGLTAAIFSRAIRMQPDDGWTGVICGSVSGFAATITFGGFRNPRDLVMPLAAAILGGVYSGAAASQSSRRRRFGHRRTDSISPR